MTPQEIRAFQKWSGLSREQFALMLTTSTRTLKRWVAGTQDVPTYVDVIGELMAESPEARQHLIAAARVLQTNLYANPDLFTKENDMTAEELKTLRIELNLTQEQFARMIGAYGNRTVCRWERGERPIPEYVEIFVDLIENCPDAERLLMKRAVG